jgi:hypothetical protein
MTLFTPTRKPSRRGFRNAAVWPNGHLAFRVARVRVRDSCATVDP